MESTKFCVKFEGLKTATHETMENNGAFFSRYFLFHPIFKDDIKILTHPLWRVYLFNHIKNIYFYKFNFNTL